MINSDENNENALTIDIKDLKSLASEGKDISQILKRLNLSDSDSITHLKITNCKDGELDLREYIGQDKYFKNELPRSKLRGILKTRRADDLSGACYIPCPDSSRSALSSLHRHVCRPYSQSTHLTKILRPTAVS